LQPIYKRIKAFRQQSLYTHTSSEFMIRGYGLLLTEGKPSVNIYSK